MKPQAKYVASYCQGPDVEAYAKVMLLYLLSQLQFYCFPSGDLLHHKSACNAF